MYFRFRTITGIEANSLKSIKKELNKIRQDYVSIIKPVKSDIDNYHIVAFHKFTFLFHQTLSKILKIKSMHTTNELVDYIESLNSKNYNLSKTVKQKEDLLLKETDKKKFFALKEELEKIIYDKNFFATVEKNIVKNNLIVELREFTDQIDEMEFSGKKITKDEVRKMFNISDNYVKMLTDINQINAELNLDIVKFLAAEIKKRFTKKKIVQPVRKKRIREIKVPVKQKSQEHYGNGWSIRYYNKKLIAEATQGGFNNIKVVPLYIFPKKGVVLKKGNKKDILKSKELIKPKIAQPVKEIKQPGIKKTPILEVKKPTEAAQPKKTEPQKQPTQDEVDPLKRILAKYKKYEKESKVETEDTSANKIVPPGKDRKPEPKKEGQDHIKSIMEKYSRYASTN